ncbi:MAG TPA: alpha-E domain-containing protein [Chitinophagaceae bacterium]|nr:alpha-E domain-containing protein [Chitinophagaceae bacterium]
MLSRIADSLFWLNRYMERADGMLRVVRTSYIFALDKDISKDITWRPVLETYTTCKEEDIIKMENDSAAVLKKIILDADNNNSLKIIINRARENARGVQDHITKEVWEIVNQLYHMINSTALAKKLLSEQAIETLDTLTRQMVLYTGITDITMPRGSGWNFMNIGKYIERCMETLELTDRQYSIIHYNLTDQQDVLFWRTLLLSLSGYELHLKTYRSININQNVLHQVIINKNFTRSVIYSLTRIDRYLEDIVTENKSEENQALIRCFGRLYSHVKFIDFDSLDALTLQHFLEKVKKDLLEFSMRLGQNFFSYS